MPEPTKITSSCSLVYGTPVTDAKFVFSDLVLDAPLKNVQLEPLSYAP